MPQAPLCQSLAESQRRRRAAVDRERRRHRRDHAGSWTGYAEAVTFPSGSGTIQFVFDSGSEGGVPSVAVTFGQGPAPTPTTDGNADPAHVNGIEEGFVYTGNGIIFDGTRLRFGVNSQETAKAWCNLQQSYQVASTPNGECSCLGSPPGNWGAQEVRSGVCSLVNDERQEHVQVGCGPFDACGGDPGQNENCYCSTAGCTIDLSQVDTVFDMQLSAGRLDGTLATGIGLSAPTHNVHFTLSP